MSAEQHPRPRQVTWGGGLMIIGSVFVVLYAYDQIAGLGSLEAQEEAARIVSEPPADGLGLSADGFQEIVRVLALVAGACAAATTVLGVEALRRSRSARLALTIITPVLVVAAVPVAGFSGALVAVAVFMLWSPPARDWFDGRAPREVPVRRSPAPPPASVAPPAPSGDPWTRGPGGAPSAPSAPSGWALPPPGQPLAGPVGPEHREPRPTPVLAACIVTWACCGLAVLGLLLTLLSVATSSAALYDQLIDQEPSLADDGLTEELLRTGTFVGVAILLPWCLAAVAFAILAFRRVRWAWLALAISTGLAGGLCLLGALASAAAAVPLAACVAALVLLLRPESRSWFARRDVPRT